MACTDGGCQAQILVTALNERKANELLGTSIDLMCSKHAKPLNKIKFE